MISIARPFYIAMPAWTFVILEQQVREAVLPVTNKFTDESNIKVTLHVGYEVEPEHKEFIIISIDFQDDDITIELVLDSTRQYQFDPNTKITYEIFQTFDVNCIGDQDKYDYDNIGCLILWAVNNHEYVLNDDTIKTPQYVLDEWEKLREKYHNK